MLQRSWGHTYIYIYTYIIDCPWQLKLWNGLQYQCIIILLGLLGMANHGSPFLGRPWRKQRARPKLQRKKKKRSRRGTESAGSDRLWTNQRRRTSASRLWQKCRNWQNNLQKFQNVFFYFYFCIWFSVFPQQMVPRIIVCGSFFSALRPLAPTLLHTHNLSTHTHSIVTYILSAHSLVTNTQHCQEYQLTSEYKERDDSNSGLTAGAPSAKGWRMQLAKTAIADSQEQFFVHCFFASCFISQAQLWQRTPKWQLRLAQFMYVRYTFPAWMSAGGFHPFRWSVQGGVRDPQLVGLILFVFVWNWGTPSLSDTSSFVHLK